MTAMTADAIVGENIHMHLFRRRLTRRALANFVGCSEQALGRKVNGYSTFTLDELLLTSQFLDVPLIDLLPGEDYTPEPGAANRAPRNGGKRWLPGLDSNQQHSGYALALVRSLPAEQLEVAA
jgi:transcriptional regulator with XRE-family HTH domain